VLEPLVGMLESWGWEVEAAANVSTALERLYDNQEVELVIPVFVGVPREHAEAACRRFHLEFPHRRLELLGVVEKGQLGDLDPLAGLSDFVVHPASAEELQARLEFLLWEERQVEGPRTTRLGALVVDRGRHEVVVEGRPVGLTLKEYELLVRLVDAEERALTREQILAEVWGRDYLGGERTVDVHIRRLRAKLPQLAEAIETVHGVGYRFTAGLVRE
jgi:DNA-binding response OmpR family regulator